MAAQKAQILIQIRGAIKAAQETTAVANAVDDLDDELSDAQRQALKTGAAMTVLERQLKRVGIASAGSAAATSVNTLAMRGLMVATLGVALMAVPALVAALGAGTVAALAFGAGIAGLGLAIGVMAAGAVMRFEEMSSVAGSAAAEMKASALGLKSAFGEATAGGADRVFAGLVPLLTAVSALVTGLGPDFTAVGGAIGDALQWFGAGLGELRPELSSLLQATTGVFQPLAQVALMLISLFARVATEAMPYVIDALQGLVPLIARAQAAITDGAIGTAFTIMGTALRGVLAILGGIADTLGPVLLPAAAELAATLAGTGSTFGAVIGLILAGIVQIGQGALPGLVETIGALAPAFQAIVDSGALTTLGSVLGTVFGTAAKVIGFVVTQLQSVGLLKPVILGLVGAFVAWRVAQVALNLAMRVSPIGLLITGLTLLAVGVVFAYRKFEWFRNAVNGAWRILQSVFGWVRDHWQLVLSILTGPIGAAVVFIVGHFGQIKSAATGVVGWVRDRFNGLVSFVGGLPGRLGGLFSGMWDGMKTGLVLTLNWVIDKINVLIRAYNKLPLAPNVGEIGHVGDGGPAPGLGAGSDRSPNAGMAHGVVRRALGGPIFGGAPYTDRILAALMPGEHVLTRQEVSAAGGHGAIFGIRAALRGGAAPAIPAFATGGPVGSAGNGRRTRVPLGDRLAQALPDVVNHIRLDLDGREVARSVDRVRLRRSDRED